MAWCILIYNDNQNPLYFIGLSILCSRFALDLYKNMLLDVNLPFTNPFRKTTMISYNSRSKVSDF
jgi:hypothetical protein